MLKSKYFAFAVISMFILWGCSKETNSGITKKKSVDTVSKPDTIFRDTTFSNWKILDTDYRAANTYFTGNQIPGTIYMVGDSKPITNPVQEIIIWFNKRLTSSHTYKVTGLSVPTDSTCSISIDYNNFEHTFFSGNSGFVNVTVSGEKVTAYFSNVNISDGTFKTTVSGFLIINQ